MDQAARPVKPGYHLLQGLSLSVVVHVAVAWTMVQFADATTYREMRLQGYATGNWAESNTGRFAGPSSPEYPKNVEEQATSPGAEQVDEQGGDSVVSEDSRARRPAPPRASEKTTEEPKPAEPDPTEVAASTRDSSEAKRVRNSSDESSAESTATSSSKQGSGPKGGRGTRATFPTIAGEKGAGGGGEEGVALRKIEGVFANHQKELVRCYTTRRDYISTGSTVVIEVWVGDRDQPTKVRILRHTTNQHVADCIAERVRDWPFPRLEETVSFKKAFTFRHASGLRHKNPLPQRRRKQYEKD